MRLKDLAGQKFNRLTALSIVGRAKSGGVTWLCRCECLTEIVVRGKKLVFGSTKSCGCLKREKDRSQKGRARKNKAKHAVSGTPMYQVWAGMRDRCRNQKNKYYDRYGGRGITICERWDSFENFCADMGERPAGLTIERIDNDKGYSPDNCRWATAAEQNRNKTGVLKITIDGVTRCLSEWAREVGVTRHYLAYRIKKNGQDAIAVVRAAALSHATTQPSA